MGFNVTNQVQKQATDQCQASSCSSSYAAPAKAPAKDTFEKAPAKAPACSSSSSNVPCKAVPPAPGKAPACSSSSSSCVADQAPAKAPVLSSSTSSVAPVKDAKGVAQVEQCAKGLAPEAYRARLNKDIEAAEWPHGSHRAAVKDMRELARQLICQHGNEAFYTARLEPLNVSHRRAVIEAVHRAKQAQLGKQACEGSPVKSVPGGGIHAWATAVYKETHGYKVKGAADRAAGVQLIAATIGLIEDAQVAGLGDHTWRIERRSKQLKRHLRHLAETRAPAKGKGKGKGVDRAKGVAQGEQCDQGQQAQGAAGKKKSSWRSRFSKVFGRKKKKAAAPAKGEARAKGAAAKGDEVQIAKPQNAAKPVVQGPSSAQQSSAEIVPQQPVYQDAPAAEQQSSAEQVIVQPVPVEVGTPVS